MRASESCCLKAAGIGTTRPETYNIQPGENIWLPEHWDEQVAIDFGHALIREMGNKVHVAQPVDNLDLIELGYFSEDD